MDKVTADFTMNELLNGTYNEVKQLLQRNIEVLDEIIERLCTPAVPSPGEEAYSGNSLSGAEVNGIVAARAHRADVAKRDAEEAVFL